MSMPLSIKRNMLWNSFGSIFFLGCQWLISIIIVRLSFGFDAAGVYSLASSVFMMFQPIANYRMYTYQVSDITNENSPGEYMSFRVITCSFTLIFIMTYAFLTCSSTTWLTILTYSIWMLSSLFLDSFHAENQRYGRMDITAKSFILQGICTVMLFTFVFAITHNLPITLTSIALATIAIGRFFDLRKSSVLARFKSGISLGKTKQLLLKCLPIVIGALACSTAPTICRQYLFSSHGEAALGIYASVAAPVTIVQMGANYIYSPLLGLFAKQYADNEHRTFLKLFGKTLLGIVCLGVVAALFLEFAGIPILVLMFGEQIAPYGFLLQPLLLMSLLTAFLWFVSDLLVSIRDMRSTFIASSLSFVTALILMVPFIDNWGMNGVSFCGIAYSSVSIVFMLFMLFANLRKTSSKKKD